MMDQAFLINTELQYENRALKKQLEDFRTGERFKKMQKNYSRVIAGYIKEISRLKKELADAHAQAVSVRDLWFDECEEIWKKYEAEIEKKEREIKKLEEKIWKLIKERDDEAQSHKEQLSEKDRIIEELKDRLAHAEALLNRDSTNTNTPTGQTPPGKNKHIPNTRRGTGRRKGGQPGHEQHKLENPPEEEINAESDHPIGEGEACPRCGSEDLEYTGEWENKYEIEIEINVKKVLHKYWLYRCKNCGELVRTGIDPNHRAECSYGANVQALALSLMNTTNAAINKVPLMLSGMTGGEVCPSEGYVAKLQRKASKGLEQFMDDLFHLVITQPLLYWDDTVVMADKSRICLRFYGDETIAYYVAHQKKDMNGILEDGILEALTETAKVMHDHNRVNYNSRFRFMNLECNAHLQRDLQKSVDETGHKELAELKALISKATKDRKDLIEKEVYAFDKEYIESFNSQVSDILERAEKTAKENRSQYSGPFERAIVTRVKDFRDNFFAWVEDFTIPTTNNLSERSLRGVKTKMKVSGQFASTETANNYARIRSYIETCRRNGINEIEALSRLSSGNPYTVEEIFSHA